MNGLDDRWGRSCPVCGQLRGKTPPFRDGKYRAAPSVRLEVALGPDEPPFGWRLTAFDGEWSLESRRPAFRRENGVSTYVLCGGGHIFRVPVSNPPDVFNMIASIGSPAGGKSYLLARMLSQDLNRRAERHREARLVEPAGGQWDALERSALEFLTDMYQETRTDGEPIDPTRQDGGDRLLPRNILGRVVSQELADRTVEELAKVIAPATGYDPLQWGAAIRQPIVQATTVGDLTTWNGIADLPGEAFAPGGFGMLRAQLQLKEYDSLIWSVDPAVTTSFNKWFSAALPDRAERTAVLNGSLRPGSTRREGTEHVQVVREAQQSTLASELSAVENMFVRTEGGGMRLLVAVSKCDLFELGRRTVPLSRLGPQGRLRAGIARYLQHAADRHADGTLTTTEDAGTLLGRYLFGGGDAGNRRLRCEQVATALLSHYDNVQDALWQLIQYGGGTTIPVPGDGSALLLDYRLRLPSIDEHLDTGLRRVNADAVQMRDIVMSAMGCGVMFALGLDGQVELLLHHAEKHGDVRFFLCSPLSSVPREKQGTDHQIQLYEGRGRFPGLDEHSAALTQLRLSSLWKALA